jgi:hypothetical protein
LKKCDGLGVTLKKIQDGSRKVGSLLFGFEATLDLIWAL